MNSIIKFIKVSSKSHTDHILLFSKDSKAFSLLCLLLIDLQ